MFTRYKIAVLALVILLGVAGALPSGRAAAQQSPDVAGTAGAFEVNLGALMAEHADLALMALQKRYDVAADATAAGAQLDQNGAAIAQALGSVYGQAAADQFLALWRQHIAAYLLFTDGLRETDLERQARASGELRDAAGVLSALLGSLAPSLSVAAIEAALTEHINQALAALSAYAAADYSRVYTLAHAAHMHMADTGAMLGQAIVQRVPTRFAQTLGGDEPLGAAAGKRMLIVGLMTEHSTLTFIVMQKAVLRSPDLQAAAAQLNANVDELARAIGVVEAGFPVALRARVAALTDFSTSLATGNTALQLTAMGTLAGTPGSLTSALPSGTALAVNASFEQTFGFHAELLIRAISSFYSGDSPAAYDAAHQAYLLAIRLGTRLALSAANAP